MKYKSERNSFFKFLKNAKKCNFQKINFLNDTFHTRIELNNSLNLILQKWSKSRIKLFTQACLNNYQVVGVKTLLFIVLTWLVWNLAKWKKEIHASSVHFPELLFEAPCWLISYQASIAKQLAGNWSCVTGTADSYFLFHRFWMVLTAFPYMAST